MSSSGGLVVGARQTGKTTLLVDLLWQRPDVEFILVLTATNEKKERYKTTFPQTAHVFSHQELPALLQLYKDKLQGVFKTCFVLDGIVYNRDFTRSPEFRELFTARQTLGIDLYVAMQYLKILPMEFRDTLDDVYVMGKDFGDNLRELSRSCFNNFAGGEAAFVEQVESLPPLHVMARIGKGVSSRFELVKVTYREPAPLAVMDPFTQLEQAITTKLATRIAIQSGTENKEQGEEDDKGESAEEGKEEEEEDGGRLSSDQSLDLDDLEDDPDGEEEDDDQDGEEEEIVKALRGAESLVKLAIMYHKNGKRTLKLSQRGF